MKILDNCVQLARDSEHQRGQSGDYLILTVTQLPACTVGNTPDEIAPESSPRQLTGQTGVLKAFPEVISRLIQKLRYSFSFLSFFLGQS